MKKKTWKMPAAVSLLVFAVAVMPLPCLAAEWPEVKEMRQGSIRYVNGGFGLEERAAMPTGFPLEVVFATTKGHYLSDVQVDIYTGQGRKAFSLAADNGPWLMVDLEPGRYRLTAVHNGHKKEVPSFSVPSKGTRTVLVSWPISQVDMGLKE
jgi:hypothetical protein